MKRILVDDPFDVAPHERIRRGAFRAIALGPRSLHTIVDVRLDGEQVRLGPGELFVAELGSPFHLVELRNVQDDANNALAGRMKVDGTNWERLTNRSGHVPIELLVFENDAELAAAAALIRRRAYTVDYQAASWLAAGAVEMVHIPMAGRARVSVLLSPEAGTLDTISIIGRRYNAGGTAHDYTLASALSATAAAPLGKVIENEDYDLLVVKGQAATGGGTQTGRITAEAE